MQKSGRLQRQALTAAERAIEALGRGDPVSARMAFSTALDKDQTGMYWGVADAFDLVVGHVGTERRRSPSRLGANSPMQWGPGHCRHWWKLSEIKGTLLGKVLHV